MKILFLVPYPSEGPSNRYRVEQYFSYLDKCGIAYSLHPFWSSSAFKVLYKKGYRIRKMYFFIMGTLRRLMDLMGSFKYDIVFIHRESYPIGGAFFEKIFRFFNKRIIFDFDDAIFMKASSRHNSFIERYKKPAKIAEIIRISDHVIAGNAHLAEFSVRRNPNTHIIPTSIDTDKYHPVFKDKADRKVVVGWMGSVTTSDFLDPMADVFKTLAGKYDNLEFKIIGGSASFDSLPNITRKQWSHENEISDLGSFDIGIMPMPDNEWTRGKCAFKAILYMSMGIPTVCSPVGVNKDIIKDGKNGFLANGKTEWIDKISRLVESRDLRDEMGAAGRMTIEKGFSISVNAPKLIEVINQAYANKKG